MTDNPLANIHPHSSQKKVYLIVFGALGALTLLTVGVSYLRVARPVAIAIALAVAFTKVSLITLFFMHMISEKKLIRSLFCAAIFFALLLLGLILPDFLIK